MADVPPAPMPDDAKVTCPGGETCHWWNPKTDTWVHENVGKYRDYCFPSHAELHADGQVVEMVSLEVALDHVMQALEDDGMMTGDRDLQREALRDKAKEADPRG